MPAKAMQSIYDHLVGEEQRMGDVSNVNAVDGGCNFESESSNTFTGSGMSVAGVTSKHLFFISTSSSH